jgi:septal ring factor EnvC (AmiA/AmiB activator)
VDQLANIESQIKSLWEKAQQAGELISRLRTEKKEIQAQNRELEQEIAKLRTEMSAREQQIQKLIAAQANAAHESKSTAILANGERDALTAKAKELLARIEAYL